MKPVLSASNSLRVEIAGLGFQVECADQDIRTQLTERYAGFFSPAQDPNGPLLDASLSARITRLSTSGKLNDLSRNISFQNRIVRFDGQDVNGIIDEEQGWAELSFSSQYGFEVADYFLRVALAVMAFRSGGLMVHAAGIVRAEKAYLFLGHSGSGKTTVARLSAGELVLNDDLIVLMPESGSWQAYSTPFWNPSQVRPAARHASLAGFYHLVQDKHVALDPMPASQATAGMIANCPVLPGDPARSLELLERIQSFVGFYPSYRLHFLPDASFWQAIEPSGI